MRHAGEIIQGLKFGPEVGDLVAILPDAIAETTTVSRVSVSFTCRPR